MTWPEQIACSDNVYHPPKGSTHQSARKPPNVHDVLLLKLHRVCEISACIAERLSGSAADEPFSRAAVFPSLFLHAHHEGTWSLQLF